MAKELYLPFKINNKFIGFVMSYHKIRQYEKERLVCWRIITRIFKNNSFRSKKHFDGTMFKKSFIVWANTPDGVYSHHMKLSEWDKFNHLKELDHSPEYDGHTIDDVERLWSLIEKYAA